MRLPAWFSPTLVEAMGVGQNEILKINLFVSRDIQTV